MLLRSNMGVRPCCLAALSAEAIMRRPSFSNWSMLSWRTSPRRLPDVSCCAAHHPRKLVLSHAKDSQAAKSPQWGMSKVAPSFASVSAAGPSLLQSYLALQRRW